MNKKGKTAQYKYFLAFIIGILVFMYFSGILTSLVLKNTFSNIPPWFWIALVIFALLMRGGRRK